ncbi:MAG: hypothetical protein EOP45_16205, partial [Sphingobacteriaceae bacterium]
MGGGCAGTTDTGDNSAPDLSKYSNLTIDGSNNTPTRFTHPGFCEYCGGAAMSTVNCGSTGEFAPDGDGDGSCKCRAMCQDSCCRKACKRVAYNGDATKCCTNDGMVGYGSGSSYLTCNPRNTYKDSSCDEPLKTYCQSGTNLFDQQVCKNWISIHQTQATQNGNVDTVLNTVCSRSDNLKRPECACVVGASTVATELPSANSLPVQCMLNSCANQTAAYKTISQLAPCNITNCSMNLTDANFVANNPGKFSTSFTQQCGNTVS